MQFKPQHKKHDSSRLNCLGNYIKHKKRKTSEGERLEDHVKLLLEVLQNFNQIFQVVVDLKKKYYEKAYA